MESIFSIHSPRALLLWLMHLAHGDVVPTPSNHSSGSKYLWPTEWSDTNIAIKELFPLVVSAAVWGSSWRGSRVSFLSDNQAVVHVLSSRSAKDPALAHLMRCLFFLRPSSVLSTQPPISRVPTTIDTIHGT